MIRQPSSPGVAGRYSTTAIIFHWLLAVLIPGMLGLGWYMMSIEETPSASWYFDLHKSIGIVIAVTVVLRLLWRLGHCPPPLPTHVARWQVRVSKASHLLLYASFLAMPTFGLSGTLLSEDELSFFGLPLTSILSPDKTISEVLFSVHGVIAWILAGLIAVHVLAALKHLLIEKDRVFQRMWF